VGSIGCCRPHCVPFRRPRPQAAAVLRVFLTQPHVVVAARPKQALPPPSPDSALQGTLPKAPDAPMPVATELHCSQCQAGVLSSETSTAEDLAALVPGAALVRLERLSHGAVRTFLKRAVAPPGSAAVSERPRLGLAAETLSSDLLDALCSPTMLRLAIAAERGGIPPRPPASAVIAGEGRGQGGTAPDLVLRAPLAYLCTQLEALLVEQVWWGGGSMAA
jgi:hypothetical protein